MKAVAFLGWEMVGFVAAFYSFVSRSEGFVLGPQPKVMVSRPAGMGELLRSEEKD